MGTIAVHEFISLDGVFENPTWTFDYPFDPKMGKAIADVMRACDAILLGHTTYEMFAPAWAPRTASEDPGAPFMNDSPKYVVASTPLKAEWKNSTALGSYTADAIRSLKSKIAHGLYISGSGTLVRALLADHLVDELHLFVFPVALGSGGRLFADAGDATKLELKGHDVFNNGVVYLSYRCST
jgi:dihydrofolate reductase